MAFEPLAGLRQAGVSERRRGREFAEAVRRLTEETYPHAEKIRLEWDNLFAHTAAAFYATFPAEQPAGWPGRWWSSSTRRFTAFS